MIKYFLMKSGREFILHEQQKNMPVNEYKPIEQLLKERIGLDAASLGSKAVSSAAAERMRQTGLETVADYATLAASSPEMEALIELVVIPETWFFRDSSPFIFLADFIRSEWKPARAKDPLRILSAPCATGEEPYSIVMTCLNCDLAKNQFAVDAIDINEKFLAKARKAVYGRNSFRGPDLEFRGHYFNREGETYALKPDVRECVRFFKANVIEPDCFYRLVQYDIIFCRNLMIYLHEEARLKIIAAIENRLTPGGLLFVGHAETIPALMEKFETVNHCSSFTLRKRTQKKIKPECAGKMEPIDLPPPAVQEAVHKTEPWPENNLTPMKTSGSIESAIHLADTGRLKDAALACEEIIKIDASNARAHFLMGLIREAEGDNRGAEAWFNRAIYLEADFTEAIFHLAVLKEENGDIASAEILQRRAVSINTESP